MYLILDSTTQQVLHAQPGAVTAGSGQTVIQVSSTLPQAAACLSQPLAWWWDGSALQPWPTVTASLSGTTLTVTVTAAAPPPTWTLPTSATVGVGGTAWSTSVPLTAGTGTLSLAFHDSLTSAPVPFTIQAGMALPEPVVLGNPAGTPIGLQVITTQTPLLVAPAGPGSRTYLRAFYLGLTPQTQTAILTEALQNLMIATSVAAHVVLTRIVPALTASTYTPLTLSSAESAALTNWQTTVAQYQVALGDLLDSSGTPIPPYAELQGQAPVVYTALQAYATAVSTLPNLE